MLGITVYIYIYICVPPYLPCGPAKVHFDVNIHIYIYIFRPVNVLFAPA